MTKNTALKIISAVIKIVPIGVYSGFNLESFYSTTPKGLTISSIFVLTVALMFFKDKVKKWLVAPSAFKVVLIGWIFSLICICIGDQLFTISSILLGSFIAALPIDIWEKSIVNGTDNQENVTYLKILLQELK